MGEIEIEIKVLNLGNRNFWFTKWQGIFTVSTL